jgi:ketopantoate hydroxymethyltransferase
MKADMQQIYLAVYMEVVSFPQKIQKEIVPVVSHMSYRPSSN